MPHPEGASPEASSAAPGVRRGISPSKAERSEAVAPPGAAQRTDDMG
ncbi:MAG TPA: hypothetical protein VJC16_05435 [Candidatus Nanoarchaeia archaeon]|nr:hypothetical protein [Candidatus Nanoarchaeia archaeon]